MALFSAFQSSAFQNSAYQIVPGKANNDNRASGGYSSPAPKRDPNHDPNAYLRGKIKWESEQRELKENAERELSEAQRKRIAKQIEIERLEARRADDLANMAMQIELMDMLRQLKAYDDMILQYESLLAMYRRDEEDVMILLYALGI